MTKFIQTQAVVMIAPILLAASLVSAADKKPQAKGFKPHPVNKTFYIKGDMNAAKAKEIEAKISGTKSVTKVEELTESSGYVRVAFDTHVITSHMIAMSIMDSGDFQVYLKIEIPEYDEHKAAVDKVFALLLEKQKVKITPSDDGKGHFTLTYLPIELKTENLRANGFNYGHLGHKIHDPAPRGLGLNIKFYEAPKK